MNRKGFTMVELLGAIVILSILMTIGMNTYFRQREKSSRKAYDMMHESVYSAAEEYYIVVKGDTLGAIARKFNMALNKLLGLNPNIKNPNLIHVGDKIRVK